MSTFSASTTLHVSPSPRKSTHDSVGLTGGQSESVTPYLSLRKIMEGEHTYPLHIVQDNMEARDADPHTRSDAGSTVMCLDLSTLNDQHCLMSGLFGDKTPVSYGDYVFRNRSESHQSARVCLEKRFNSVCGGSPFLQDNQSGVPSNFLTVHQQPAETQEPLIYRQMEKWVKDYGGHPAELSNSHTAGVSNPTTSMCGQVFGHIPPMVDHQVLIHPFTYLLEMDNTNAQLISSSGPTDEHQLVIAEDAVTKPAASRKHRKTRSSHTIKAVPETGCKSFVRSTRTKEIHNKTERERRRRIRSSCDELNMLVPFCYQKLDKATTLQRTTDFLTYINEAYGDALKEEFKNAFCGKKAQCPKPRSSSDQNPAHQEKA